MSSVRDWDNDLLVTFVDNAGVARTKLIPRGRVGSAVTKGIGIGPALAGFCFDDEVVDPDVGNIPVGDMRLVPDLNAAAPIAPGLYWAPVCNLDQALQPMATCTRSTALRLESQARDRGFEYLVSFEHEFTLFASDADGGYKVAHEGPGYGLLPFLQLEDFLRDLLAELEKAGVEVEQVHPEYGDGQIEVSTSPLPPVAAADRAVLVRLIASRTALRHGMRTSFAPMTAVNAIGNGAHVHFSASKDGRNLFAGGEEHFGMTRVALNMIGGLLKELPAATGIFAPSVVSYERLVPGHWSGAWAAWGHENRELALRFISGTRSHESTGANCEVKIVDPSANPYLVTATILALTQQGVADGTIPPLPFASDPGQLDPSERAELGIARLPDSLEAAIAELESSDVLRVALNPEAIDYIVAARRSEVQKYGALPVQERIAILKWRY